DKGGRKRVCAREPSLQPSSHPHLVGDRSGAPMLGWRRGRHPPTASVPSLFGIDVPIIQAPIGSWSELSAAVSNAGGLGMLGLSWDDPSEVRRLIRETSNLTAAPFAMNLKLDEDQHNRLEAGLEEGVRVVSLFWSRLAADDDYVRMAHQGGALVTLTVGSARE